MSPQQLLSFSSLVKVIKRKVLVLNPGLIRCQRFFSLLSSLVNVWSNVLGLIFIALFKKQTIQLGSRDLC